MFTLNGPIIAHRGAAAYAPENTLAAFEKARALGVSFIECDVVLSEDNQAFIFHDKTLKRTTNGRGQITHSSAAYLRSLDAGSWFTQSWFSRPFKGEKIPQLSETLDWAIQSNVCLNLELKPEKGQTEQMVITVLSEINQRWPRDRSLPLISSFDLPALRLCRELSPELPLGFLLHRWDEASLHTAKALNCVAMHVYHRLLTKARVATLKEAGYLIIAYTVNRQRLAKRLLAMGVDAVFSDYPDLLAG